jgi:hypothetical protein
VDAGCDEVQGYYFNRLVPLTEIVEVLARESHTSPASGFVLPAELLWSNEVQFRRQGVKAF